MELTHYPGGSRPMSGIGTEEPAKTLPAESRWHLPRLLSVDEFLDGYADDRCELLGGETRPKPLGTGKHSKMQRGSAASA
jgi:hypothetical protein